MLYWSQVWKHMHEKTGTDVEKRAVMEIITYFEKQMDMVIEQSKIELDKRNENNEVQGLKKKKRIDSECIKNAIKNINNKDVSSLSERTGGEQQKEIIEENKHLQNRTEVE